MNNLGAQLFTATLKRVMELTWHEVQADLQLPAELESAIKLAALVAIRHAGDRRRELWP